MYVLVNVFHVIFFHLECLIFFHEFFVKSIERDKEIRANVTVHH